MNRFAITLASATALAVALIAAAPVGAHANIVQTGDQKYSTNDGDERDNIARAQSFCRHNGFKYAHIIWTKSGVFRWDHDTTDFFCMRDGDEVHMAPSIDVDIW